jgi:hypothetical protein
MSPPCTTATTGVAVLTFCVAVNGRRFGRQTNRWADTAPVFHRVISLSGSGRTSRRLTGQGHHGGVTGKSLTCPIVMSSRWFGDDRAPDDLPGQDGRAASPPDRTRAIPQQSWRVRSVDAVVSTAGRPSDALDQWAKTVARPSR